MSVYLIWEACNSRTVFIVKHYGSHGKRKRCSGCPGPHMRNDLALNER